MNSTYENTFPTADEGYVKRKTIFKTGKKNHYTPWNLQSFSKLFFFFFCTWLHLGKIIIPFSLRGTPKGRKTGNAQKNHPWVWLGHVGSWQGRFKAPSLTGRTVRAVVRVWGGFNELTAGICTHWWMALNHGGQWVAFGESCGAKCVYNSGYTFLRQGLLQPWLSLNLLCS